jgi:signal transduction histidine kinase
MERSAADAYIATMASNLPLSSQDSAGAGAGLLPTIRRGFIAYARWLDSITWIRFFLLSLLTLIAAGILSELPPFSLRWGPDRAELRPPGRNDEIARAIDEMKKSGKSVEINIDEHGIRVTPISPPAAASAPSAPGSGAGAPVAPAAPAAPRPGVHITPDGVTIRVPGSGAITDAQAKLDQAIAGRDKEAIAEAKAELKAAIAEAKSDLRDALADIQPQVHMVKAFSLGDHMPGFAMLLIFVSMIIKIMAAGRFKAEAQAVQATEIAESEALKRQVVEARMAAMQAQVEPHFLFNTLASIDHLIETDPPRASRMQKNLIALLRASMPTMREANAQGKRDLGRELEVIRPYLEILKVRMEERLRTEVRVSDGLLSAEFPPMMLQSLVENAIKHGLEPKPDGGTLTISAEIVHGKLAVTVADTGLGFGQAATAGTGIGLNNIRERLQLLYGNKASLAVAENPGGGTAVTITIPYLTRNANGASE